MGFCKVTKVVFDDFGMYVWLLWMERKSFVSTARTEGTAGAAGKRTAGKKTAARRDSGNQDRDHDRRNREK